MADPKDRSDYRRRVCPFGFSECVPARAGACAECYESKFFGTYGRDGTDRDDGQAWGNGAWVPREDEECTCDEAE